MQKQLSQLHHYTGQLAKDTAQQLMKIGEIPNLDAREKMQKERLQDDFGKALNSFQRLQTEAAERERAKLAAARQQNLGGGDDAYLPPPSDGDGNKQNRTQMMIQVNYDNKYHPEKSLSSCLLLFTQKKTLSSPFRVRLLAFN